MVASHPPSPRTPPRSGAATRDARLLVVDDDPGLRAAALAWAGPVVLGPGPGNPEDSADPRMRALRALAAELLAGHRHGLLGVCLGHELLASELGLPLVRKAEPAQGAQTRIGFFGAPEVVGFYNTYTAACDAELAARGFSPERHRRETGQPPLPGPGGRSPTSSSGVRVSYPTLPELERVLAPHFRVLGRRHGDHPLAGRCPIYGLERTD